MISLHLKELSFENARPILHDVQLSLSEGERVALMGVSGCGKSTLLRVLMGIEKLATGTLTVLGKTIPLRQWDNGSQTFSIVTQAPHLLPWKTVLENIAMAQLSQKHTAKHSQSALASVGLEHAETLYPFEISQGMASRISFARTLLMERPVVLLDEPFAALDALTKLSVQDWFETLAKERNLTSLLVTHDVREALRLCHRIVVLGGSPATVVQVIENVQEARANGAAAAADIENRVIDSLKLALPSGK